MTQNDRTERLVEMLLSTRNSELNCDAVLRHAAELVERGLADAALREQVEHHLKLCGECSEEIDALRRFVEE